MTIYNSICLLKSRYNPVTPIIRETANVKFAVFSYVI